jgi:N-acetylneuraminate 9-O-acetyltransferase
MGCFSTLNFRYELEQMFNNKKSGMSLNFLLNLIFILPSSPTFSEDSCLSLNLPIRSCSLLSLKTFPQAWKCISNLGELHFVGDSITRTALADFTSRLIQCDRPIKESSYLATAQGTTDACTYLLDSRKTRKPFSIVISQRNSDVTPVKIFYWPITTVQNISKEVWFNDVTSTFSVEPSATLPKATLILNWGLWNLKYDGPVTSLDVDTAVLVKKFKKLGLGNNPHRKVFWRSLTSLEGNNPSFPAHFTPEKVRDFSFQTSKIWSLAGYPIIDAFMFTEILADELRLSKNRRGESYTFTTDGTHYKENINVGLISFTIGEICREYSMDLERILQVAVADDNSSEENKCCNTRGLVEMTPLPSSTPPAAPIKSSVSMWTTTSLVLTMLLSVIGVTAFFRTSIKEFAATSYGILISATFISVIVFCLDVLKLLPIVSKERQLGPDSLIAITGVLFIAVLFGLKTTVRQRNSLSNTAAQQQVIMKPSSNEEARSNESVRTHTSISDVISSTGGGEVGAEKVVKVTSRNEDLTQASAESEFLSPEQTLEFKGWMMCIFLLYHYWDVKLVYNLARILVAAYLFLTGYGNFLSLSKKAPTLHKFCIAFVRINAFSAMLMCVTRQSWMLYYICPLHTFWTAFVYIFFAVWPVANSDPKLRLAKLMLFLLALVFLYEIPSATKLFYIPFFPLLAYKGAGDEWIFRSRLDAYVPWIGMLFAAFQPQVQDFVCALSKKSGLASAPPSDLTNAMTTENVDATSVDVESGQLLSTSSSADTQLNNTFFTFTSVISLYIMKSPLILWGFLVVLSLVHTFVILPLPKTDYNETHRFTSFVPIISFLLLRNATPDLRKTTIAPLQLIGNMSLESYLLQFHVWLANNAKDIVVLFPNFRLVSFVIQTTIFLTLAYTAAAATSGVLKVMTANARWAYFATSLITLVIVAVNISIVISESAGWGVLIN